MINLLRIFPWLLSVLQLLLLGLILVCLFPYIAKLNPQLLTDPLYLQVLKYTNLVFLPLDSLITRGLPLAKSYGLLGAIKIILCLSLICILKLIKSRLNRRINYSIKRYKIMKWRSKIKISKSHTLYEELEKKLMQIKQVSTEDNLDKLQDEFEELKRKLATKSRMLAFLSMDIVDSTGMKHAEDKPSIQLDFLRYKRLVESILKEHQCVQSAWTPDGVMASFHQVQQAINAGQAVLQGVVQFNAHEKNIQQNFIIRAGIHAGTIVYDEKMPLSEVSDQILDITGHMQKYATPGRLAISRVALDSVKDANGFYKTDKQIDMQEMWEWILESPNDSSETI